jgi:hypothetical protein
MHASPEDARGRYPEMTTAEESQLRDVAAVVSGA